MLKLLDKTDDGKVRSLFAELETYHLAIGGVYAGIRAAKVWVDDLQNPRSAFMYSGHWYFVVGRPDNADFNHDLHALIMSPEFANDPFRGSPEEMFLHCYPLAWRDQFPVIFGERLPHYLARSRYLFERFPFDWRTRIPEGFTVRRIDRELLENSSLKNIQSVNGMVRHSWGAPSVETYNRQGVGACILHENTIASWCLTVNIAGNACEMGIETDSDYRRLGLGTLAAMAAVDWSLQQGLTVIDWHCDDSNAGSRGVAEKAGFVKQWEYVNYPYFFDAGIHFTLGGDYCLAEKRYQEAIDWYKKAFANWPTPDAWLYHDAARAYAMVGDRDTAFRHLNTAVDNGWKNLRFTQNCAEFRSLHDTPEWAAIIARLQEKA